MSVRKVGPKAYEVRWREGGRESRSRSRTFTRKSDADRFNDEVKRRKRMGTLADLDAGTESLNEFVKTWARVRSQRLAASTLRRYAEVYDTHVEPRLGDHQLREITPDVIGDFAADLDAAGVGKPTIRKALYILSSVLKLAVVRRRVPMNPVQFVEKPHQQSRRVRPLAPIVVEAICSLLGPRDRMLVRVLAYGGSRPFEALRLEWPDVRPKTMRLVDTKRKTERVVRLLDILGADLAEYRMAVGRPTAGYVFPRRDGALWHDTDYRNWRRRVFQPAVVAAGAGQYVQAGKTRRYVGPRPYDLRHSFVSLLVAEGLDIANVAKQAGHTVEECARTYVHVFEEFDPAEKVPADEAIRRARGEIQQRRSA